MPKTEQLQIRVTPAQKARLRTRAKQAGMDLSSYVLARALPAAGARLAELVRELGNGADERGVLAELNDQLARLPGTALRDALADLDLTGLSPLWQNYVTAMVEHSAHRAGARPPAWTRDVSPLPTPYFAVPYASLREYLLRVSPVAYRRRNLFVDATVGDRV